MLFNYRLDFDDCYRRQLCFSDEMLGTKYAKQEINELFLLIGYTDTTVENKFIRYGTSELHDEAVYTRRTIMQFCLDHTIKHSFMEDVKMREIVNSADIFKAPSETGIATENFVISLLVDKLVELFTIGVDDHINRIKLSELSNDNLESDLHQLFINVLLYYCIIKEV